MTKKRKKFIRPNLLEIAHGKPPDFCPRAKIEWTALKQNWKLPPQFEGKVFLEVVFIACHVSYSARNRIDMTEMTTSQLFDGQIDV